MSPTGLEAIASDQGITATFETILGPADEQRVDSWELEAARRAVTNLRELLLGDKMESLLADQMAESQRRAARYAAESNGEFVECHVQLRASGLHVQEYLGGVMAVVGAAGGSDEDRKRMVLEMGFPSHPEHYMVLPGAGVVETMGGLPLLTRIAPLESPPDFVRQCEDESYPIRRSGQGPLDDGTPFTYVLQQYRDTDDGLEASLRVWYPAACPPVYVEEHAQHFAIEARNLLRLVAAGRTN